MQHEKDSIRINKALSEQGFCSRRQADKLIEQGRVTINGQKAVLGDRVLASDEIRVDGKSANKKEDDVFVECPSKNDLRVGDFRNEKKLERVIGHKRSEDGTICTTLYEDVAFKDQYLPEFSTVVSTAAIATVAATTPIILNLVKPIVKNLIKKLTKKKDKK